VSQARKRKAVKQFLCHKNSSSVNEETTDGSVFSFSRRCQKLYMFVVALQQDFHMLCALYSSLGNA